MSFGDRLDQLERWYNNFHQRHALTAFKLCLAGFIFNIALFGFTSVALPPVSHLFACNAAVFFVGGAANLVFAKESNRTK